MTINIQVRANSGEDADETLRVIRAALREAGYMIHGDTSPPLPQRPRLRLVASGEPER